MLRPPAFDDGLIYFCGDVTVGCVDPDSAAPVWQHPLDLPQTAAFRPRILDRHVIVGGRGGIACLARDSGAELWRYPARIQTGLPTLGAGLVVLGDGHEIVAIELATGAERWRFAGVPDTLAAYAPSILGDRVFAGPGDGRLYCLDLAEGRLIWSHDRRGYWQYLRQIHAADGLLVAGSYKEQLLGISPTDGDVLWEFVAGNFINSHHLAGDVACLWSPTGWIYAIDIATGAVRWRHQTTDYVPGGDDWASLMAELTSRAGLLYTLDMDNTLRLLDLADGSLKAQGGIPGAVRHAVLPIDGDRVVLPMMDGSLHMTMLPLAAAD
ncbi:PQQ-like beta-propeller repeat protein [Rhodobacter sp. Har01]|uniref:PQQ-like beta-propeller repeat protein n=1 Tax=Rhodobacter sp. Har01 TaxID=2883999 RepID=UPI001D08FCA6|nr:PQQ-like beta-propeller repeat protein [Rhodobacter sp. Har01]MCB6178678.1 PQQ-like beta-propeller repeat protein [Rhodobacter sp. Har01]